MTKTDTAEAVRYRVTGMDCSACAAKIETAARSVTGVWDAKVSIASREMMLLEGRFPFGNGCQPIEIAGACFGRFFQMRLEIVN
jgi:copper chaperone CopZ